jgi:fructokinase
MAAALDVLCLGEALVDLLPDRRGRLRDCERFQAHSGGAPANVAVGLARLGLRAGFRGVLGDDELGQLLLRKLGEEGVQCSVRLTREAPTGVWFVALDEHGDRTFFTPTGSGSADKLISAQDVELPLLQSARWLHCGSSSHVRPQAQDALRAAVRLARQAGTRVSFDPNVRAHLWDDARELRALCDDVLPFCEVVKLAEDEAGPCLGVREPEQAAERLRSLGVKLACVTLGAQGALALRGNDWLRAPAPSVSVVDTTGAGDGFVAGLLSRLARGGPIEEARASELESALRFACAVGSRVCTQLGAVAGLPRAAEIASLATAP